jgi:hypothetical protein
MNTGNQSPQQKVSEEEYQAILARALARGASGDVGADSHGATPYRGPVQLALWRDRERAVPTAIIRSALFGVVQRGRRPYLEDQPIACWKNCEIKYTGGQLDQYDEDVWMQVKHFFRQQDLSAENGIRFTLRGFLKSMETSNGGCSTRALFRSLKRLTATAVSIRVGSFTYVGSLIDEFVEDEATGRYVVRINPKLAGLFGTGYTKLEAATRRGLSTQIAQHLYGYVQSHKATRRHPHRISLGRLQALMGSQTHSRDFRWKVRRAMEELQAAGAVASWRITEGDALEFVRPRGRRVAR